MIKLKPNQELLFELFDFADLIEWFPFRRSNWENVDWDKIEEEKEIFNYHLSSRCTRISEKSIVDLKDALLELVNYDESYQKGIDKKQFNDFLEHSLHDLAFLKNILLYYSGYFLGNNGETNPYYHIQNDISDNHTPAFEDKKDRLRLPVLNAVGIVKNLETQKHLLSSYIGLRELIIQENTDGISEIHLTVNKRKTPIRDAKLITELIGVVKQNTNELNPIDLKTRLESLNFSETQLKSKWVSNLAFGLWNYLNTNTSFSSAPGKVTSNDQTNIIGQLLIHFELLEHKPYRPYDNSLSKQISSILNHHHPLLFHKISRKSSK